MSDPRGTVRLKARGKEWKLHFGMSVIADLEAAHGIDDVNKVLGVGTKPEEGWRPSGQLAIDIILMSLQRYHEAEADKYLVDDIIAENAHAVNAVLVGSTPEEKPTQGNRKRSKRAA